MYATGPPPNPPVTDIAKLGEAVGDNVVVSAIRGDGSGNRNPMKGIKREGDFSKEAGGQNRLFPVHPDINTKNIQSGCRTPQEMP